MKRYILQGHKAIPVDRETYLNQQEHQNRTVAKSTIGNYLVSTVFLGLDHQFHAHGPPLLFETMVFGKGPGMAWLGKAWQARRGMAWQVSAGLGGAGQARRGTAGPGKVRLGRARQARRGTA